MLSIQYNFPKGLHAFVNELKQLYTIEMVYTMCKPKFLQQYALSKLKIDGYKIAVCSNSIRNTIEIMMQKSALIDYLDFFLSNEDVKNSKPDPEIYNLAINKLNLNPNECLIIEDNEHGYKAAINSGANVLKVNNTDDVNYENIYNKIKEIEKYD